MNNNSVLNQNAVKILRILESHGFQAYIVGGAVRDILMDEFPHDYDICTDALPPQIKDIFGSLGLKTVLVGEKYGTVQILIPTNGRADNESFEVTTFRTDNEYTDGRHPESVSFSKNLADDLKRRDFTINALACSAGIDGNIKVIDIFGGQSDIEHKIIRAVGDPCERFSEDALRMIRAVRFSAKLGFEIESGTKSAIFNLAEKISLVSRERISVETEKILLSDNPEKFVDLSDLNLLGYFMPLLGEKIRQNKFVKTEKINKIKLLGKDFCVRFAAILELYSGDADLLDELKELRLKNSDVKNITKIFSAVRIIKNKADCAKSKVFIKRILRDSGGYAANAALNIAAVLYNIDALALMREITANNEPYKLSDLKINGEDIINILNITGEKVGAVLSQCLEYVIENPEKNTRQELISFITLFSCGR